MRSTAGWYNLEAGHMQVRRRSAANWCNLEAGSVQVRIRSTAGWCNLETDQAQVKKNQLLVDTSVTKLWKISKASQTGVKCIYPLTPAQSPSTWVLVFGIFHFAFCNTELVKRWSKELHTTSLWSIREAIVCSMPPTNQRTWEVILPANANITPKS